MRSSPVGGLPLSSLKPLTPRAWRVGDRLLGGDRALVMGIVNVTPDSFHDGGRHTSLDAALRHSEALIEAGADILDIGGESSRPGAEPVPDEEEIRRVVPLIESLARRTDIPLSIDTVKSTVARRALDAGALIVNDVSGMTFDPLMWELPQGYGAGVVLNHMQGTPQTMQKAPEYTDVIGEVKDFLFDRVRLLASLGLAKDRIALDPGIGFGKRVVDNYRLIDSIEFLEGIGCPVLLGMSRKSFIGKTPGLENSDRLIPSVALAVFAALKGVSILRVHDVRETVEALRMVSAVRIV